MLWVSRSVYLYLQAVQAGISKMVDSQCFTIICCFIFRSHNYFLYIPFIKENTMELLHLTSIYGYFYSYLSIISVTIIGL